MWKRGKRPAGNMSILLIGNSNVYNNVLGGWGILRHFLIKKGRWNSHNASKMRRKLNLKDICQCMAIVFQSPGAYQYTAFNGLLYWAFVI